MGLVYSSLMAVYTVEQEGESMSKCILYLVCIIMLSACGDDPTESKLYQEGYTFQVGMLAAGMNRENDEVERLKVLVIERLAELSESEQRQYHAGIMAATEDSGLKY